MIREYVCAAVPHVEADTSLVHTDYLPREEVVRCRDCEYFSDRGDTCRWFAYQDSAFSQEVPAFVDPDGFCAWGERGDSL